MKKPLLLFSIFLLLSAVTIVDSASPAATRNLIYIRSDGSVEPSTAPIQRVENIYTFTDDVQGSVIVERDNVVIDGTGFTLQGTGANDYGSDSDQNLRTYDVSDQEEVDETIIPASNNTGIYSYAQNLTIMNLKIMEFWCAIELEYSSDNHILGNEITNNNQGIWIHSSTNNALVGNNVTANSNGISLTASHNTVSGNTIADNRGYGIQLVWSFNNISENVITNNDHGIQLDGSCHNTFKNNVFSANTYSIYISGQSLPDFLQNIDETNSVEGKPIYYWVNMKDLTVPSDAGWVALVNCTRVSVQDLNFTKKWQAAVFLVSTSESTVNRNSIKNSDQGICLIGSVNNSVSGNTITDSGDGIAVKDSSNYNIISENTLTDNIQGIYLLESSNNTVSKNYMLNNGDGIHIGSASNSIVSGNKISNSKTGINLQASSDNSLVGNTITNNTCGINLTRPPDKEINIMFTDRPIVRPGSLRNNVSGNLISDSDVGVQLDHSSDNTFVHNSFINNTNQIINYNSTFANTWDNGTEGNYWSDYAGNDNDGDGVGETPYVIDENNQDNYPLMNPYETSEDTDGKKPSTSDLTLITIAAVIGLAIVVGVAFYRRKNR